MRYYAQVVSEALFADPPRVRGVVDGHTIRRLISWEGSGRHRIFLFDIIGHVRARDMLKRRDSVALTFDDFSSRLSLTSLSRRQSALCPRCGLELLSVDFWSHYNVFHARRLWWLNSEDWSKMGLKGEYITPPEQV
jgi:hypothetical protein